MRRLPLVLLVLLSTLALAACSSGSAPGWTYAPAASTTPAPSGGGSGGPGPSASGASASGGTQPSGGASAPASGSTGSASPSESGAAAGLSVTAPVGAATGGWDPATIETNVGTAFTLTFNNEDNTAPHNLVIQKPDGSNVAVQGDTAPFTGPDTRTYQVPALTAGDYKYLCQVHPSTMVGTLTVK
jgi:plastocyanin